MSDKDREHARIMARLEELEMEEKEAGSSSEEEEEEEEEDDDEGAESSEGEEIEESGDALSDSNVQLGSGFGASCSGSNAKSHWNIQVFISS
jgi:unconventional prefoldin RPB5 interactor 1